MVRLYGIRSVIDNLTWGYSLETGWAENWEALVERTTRDSPAESDYKAHTEGPKSIDS